MPKNSSAAKGFSRPLFHRLCARAHRFSLSVSHNTHTHTNISVRYAFPIELFHVGVPVRVGLKDLFGKEINTSSPRRTSNTLTACTKKK